MKFAVFVVSLFVLVSVSTDSIGESPLRYCNPLSLENQRSIGDPAVIRYQDRYYLFTSGGFFWTSEDLVNWTYHSGTLPGGRRGTGAPSAFEYEGYLYLTGSGTGLYRTRTPRGEWEYIGDFTNTQGEPQSLFDPMVFVDDDHRVYLYWSGRFTNGIFGIELNREDLTRFAGEPQNFFQYNPEHIWERYGDYNEFIDASWIEGPWMTKRNGTYYLQYSSPGTDWKTYAVGVYTSTSPVGPFTYAPGNPVLIHSGNMINGTGHNGVVEGPDGNLWMFYSVLYRNSHRFERRIGMDPVGFDEDGNMFVHGPTETPQFAPGVSETPWAGNDNGEIPVSVNKYNWSFSSEVPGRNAIYAFDNYVRTWWEPAVDDAEPWLMIDLGSANDGTAREVMYDPDQHFMISASRILFADAGFGRTRGDAIGPYQYRIEVSSDGESFITVVDKTGNTLDKNIAYDEIDPIRCRYVRLTITGTPRNPAGILEFTLFGKPVSTNPRLNTLPIPTY